MAIHMVTRVGGEDFNVTLSRDDAGNYVAEASRSTRLDRAAARPVPSLRVVDASKERALRSLFDSLQRLADPRRGPSPEGPDAPAAA